MRAIILLTLCVAAVSAASLGNERIVGGSETTIDNYPDMVVLLSSWDFVNYYQECGGIILNERNILTAAHCFLYQMNNIARWRVRSGSSFAHSGGTIHLVSEIILYPGYIPLTIDDVAILRLASFITFSNVARQAIIAGPNYNVGDNQEVWAAGWGTSEFGLSEQLRHVQVWTINHEVCVSRFAPGMVTDNMLCSGWLDVGGRDQCGGDSGGPLYHNGIVVGICSWGILCGEPRQPGVNVRVSNFSNWIQAIANQ